MQRRLNTRFLVILTVSVVGGAVVLFAVTKVVFRDTPEKHIALAEAFVRQNSPIGAVKEYQTAVRLDPRNPALLVKLGDAIRLATRVDPDLVDKDKATWNMALEVDANYLPALQRLLDSYIEDAQIYQRPWIYSNIRTYASRIVAIDPSDAKAASHLQLSWLQAWFAGVETEPAQIDQSISELTKLYEKDPANIEIPFVVARAKFQKGEALRAQGRVPDAKAIYNDLRLDLDKSVEKHSKDARFLARSAQLYQDLIVHFRSDPVVQKDLLTRRNQCLTAAQALVKQEDPQYWEVMTTVAGVAFRTQDTKLAEQIYRELLNLRPEDRTLRLALAQLLGNEANKRNEAIELLEKPIPESNEVGVKVRFRAEIEQRTLQMLTSYRVDKLGMTREPKDRTDLIEKVEKGLTEMFNRSGETPEYLKLKGKLEQAQGKYVDAVKSYNRSHEISEQMSRPTDDDLMYQLARTYLALNQTGEAKKILENIVSRYEDFKPARLLLARTLLDEANVGKADWHMRYLERNLPDDPQVTLLLLTEARLRRDTSRIKDLYARLPEGNRDQTLSKAVAAGELGLNAEAEACFIKLLKESDDIQILQEAARFYIRTGRNDEATRLVDRAAASRPDDNAIKLLRAQLQGAEAMEIGDLVEKNIDEIKDEFQREVTRARYQAAHEQDVEAIASLEKAEKIKPNAPELWDAYFIQYLKMKNWDEAGKWMEKLVEANFDKAGGRLYRFRFAMGKQDYEGATKIGRDLTAKMPEFAQSWLALGQGLQYSLKFDEAKECYLRVLEKQATSAEAYRGLIECCYANKKFEDATRYIRDARTRLPDNTYFQRVEIDHELNYGEPERVLPLIESMLLNKGDRAEAYLAAGMAYSKTGQRKLQKSTAEANQWFTKARDVYAQAIAKWPLDRQFVGRYADMCMVLHENDGAEKALKTYSDRPENKGKPEPLLMLAEFYNRTSKPSHAQLLLQQALNAEPGNVEIRSRLVSQLASMRQFDDAIAILDQVKTEEPGLIRQKIEMLISAKRMDDARKLLGDLIKAHPDEAGYMTALIFIAMNEGKLDEAGQTIEKVLAMQPQNAMALYYRGMIRMRQATPDYDAALLDFRTARRDAPDNPDIRLALAELLLIKKDTRTAIEELEVAQQLAPGNASIRAKLIDLFLSQEHPRLQDAQNLIDQARLQPGGQESPEWALRAARAARLRGDGTLALSEMETALKYSGGNPAVLRDYLDVLLEVKLYDRLIAETGKLPAELASTWWVHHDRALAMARSGKRDNAMAEWELAIEAADKIREGEASITIVQAMGSELGVSRIMPRVLERAKTDYRWQILAASIYHSQGQFDRAAGLIDSLMQKMDAVAAADRLRLLQQAGGIYLSCRPPLAEKALDAYQRALQLAPDDLATLNNVACILVDNINPPDPAKAVTYSQRAYNIMQKNGTLEPLVMDTHGWALAQSGKLQEGLMVLQEVVQRRPFPEARLHLADAYLRSGYADQALRQLDAAKDELAQAEKESVSVDPALKKRVEAARETVQAKLKAEPASRQAKP